MDKYTIRSRHLFIFFAFLCSVGCSPLTGSHDSQISALQKSLGCAVYDAAFTSTGELESIKFTSATMVPMASNEEWTVFREDYLWRKDESLSEDVLKKLSGEKHLVSLDMIGVEVQPCAAWENLAGSCIAHLRRRSEISYRKVLLFAW